MAEKKEGKEEKAGSFETFLTGYWAFWRRLLEATVGKVFKARVGRFPQKIEDPLKEITLRQVFTFNDTLIKGEGLSKIETQFDDVGNYVWGGPKISETLSKKNALAMRFKEVGPYDNPEFVKAEHNMFENGTDLQQIPLENYDATNNAVLKELYKNSTGRDLVADIEFIKRSSHIDKELTKFFQIGAKTINFNGQVVDIHCISQGIATTLKDEFSTQIDQLKSKIDGIDPAHPLKQRLTQLDKALESVLARVANISGSWKEYLNKMVGPALGDIKSEAGTQIFGKSPANVRFKHSYKVIAQLYIDNPDNPRDTEKFATAGLDQTTDQPFPVYPWEYDKGYDENGYPLEVAKDMGIYDDGIVLLDQWYSEIAQNDWQMKIILIKVVERRLIDYPIETEQQKKAWGELKKKPYNDISWNKVKQKVLADENWNIYRRLVAFKDGLVVKDKKTGNNVTVHVRSVDRKKWIEDINVLEAALYILGEWDPYRDDIRDGRYHPHSKTAFCYLISDDIPRSEIHIKFDPTKPTGKYGYINATPDLFDEKTPSDEKKIIRYFRIPVGKTTEFQWRGDSFVWDGERKPSHLNPAFDRRALGAAAERGQPWIHWGRLYYYESCSGINEWSETPYPMVSTRGVASYLVDRFFREEYRFEDAKKALQYHEGEGYDYGTRKFGGPLSTDPLGGDYVELFRKSKQG